jgi:4-hydroxy-tetrahydrodipicolinate synthase
MVKGIITPVVTLLDEYKKIDCNSNKFLIKRLIDTGINGIVLLGSTGEFHSLSFEERKYFVEFALKYINSNIFTIVGISSTVLE